MLEAGTASQVRVDIHALTKRSLIWEAFRNLHENPLEKACFGHFCGQTRVGTQCQKSPALFCPKYGATWARKVLHCSARSRIVRSSSPQTQKRSHFSPQGPKYYVRDLSSGFRYGSYHIRFAHHRTFWTPHQERSRVKLTLAADSTGLL